MMETKKELEKALQEYMEALQKWEKFLREGKGRLEWTETPYNPYSSPTKILTTSTSIAEYPV
jgi:hypothetical protein